MKAITIRQPHAELIARGTKIIELRSWTTGYRGTLLICAGARADYDMGFPLGVAVALVDLVDITPYMPEHAAAACSRWRPRLLAWHLTNPRPVAAMPVKGRLGLFPAPDLSAPAASPRMENPPASAASRRDSDRAGTPAPA